MRTVTPEEIKRVKGHSMTMDLHSVSPRWNYNDVLTFLERKGYDVIVHKGLADVEQYRSVPNEMSVERLGIRKNCMKEMILAVKPECKLPERLDSDEAISMDVLNVFKRELKQAMMNL